MFIKKKYRIKRSSIDNCKTLSRAKILITENKTGSLLLSKHLCLIGNSYNKVLTKDRDFGEDFLRQDSESIKNYKS